MGKWKFNERAIFVKYKYEEVRVRLKFPKEFTLKCPARDSVFEPVIYLECARFFRQNSVCDLRPSAPSKAKDCSLIKTNYGTAVIAILYVDISSIN